MNGQGSFAAGGLEVTWAAGCTFGGGNRAYSGVHQLSPTLVRRCHCKGHVDTCGASSDNVPMSV
jgi:hypothetical protein